MLDVGVTSCQSPGNMGAGANCDRFMSSRPNRKICCVVANVVEAALAELSNKPFCLYLARQVATLVRSPPAREDSKVPDNHFYQVAVASGDEIDWSAFSGSNRNLVEVIVRHL